MRTLPLLLAALLLPVHVLAQDEKAKEQEEEPQERPELRFMSKYEADQEIPRGIQVNKEGAYPGYTIIDPLTSYDIHLVDMQGEVVHTWRTKTAPGGWVYLQDDGTLLRSGRVDEDPRFRGGGIGGRIERLAPDGNVLWSWDLANEDLWQHHDIEPLPNGNLLLIAWERVSGEDAVARGWNPKHLGKSGVWPDAVFEIQPVGSDDAKVVWEWHAWDHLVQDRDDGLPGYAMVPDYPERIDVNAAHRDDTPPTAEEVKKRKEMEKAMRALGYAGGDDDEEEEDDPFASKWTRSGDWMHTNSVDYHPEYQLIVLSSPELCELFIIDHSTTRAEAASSSGGRWGRGGDLLWRWGNPRNYGMGKKSDQRCFYQHNPTFVEGEKPGELRVLYFNNGGGRKDGNYSSAEELVLPFSPDKGFTRKPGEPFGPAEPAWSYSDPERFFSAFISGTQRLPNGNTLICSGTGGRVFEVTREGEVVWDYRNPFGGEIQAPDHAGNAPPLSLYRSTRVGLEHPGVRKVLGDR